MAVVLEQRGGLRVDEHLRKRLVSLVDRDATPFDLIPDEVDGSLDELSEVRRFEGWFVRLRELAERADDRASTHRVRPDGLGVGAMRIILGKLGGEELGEAEDRGERIVDLVGDARRELADSRRT